MAVNITGIKVICTAPEGINLVAVKVEIGRASCRERVYVLV